MRGLDKIPSHERAAVLPRWRRLQGAHRGRLFGVASVELSQDLGIDFDGRVVLVAQGSVFGERPLLSRDDREGDDMRDTFESEDESQAGPPEELPPSLNLAEIWDEAIESAFAACCEG